jgi:putative toxin-antitoxin system antitoxin component (TIGR02293 family)
MTRVLPQTTHLNRVLGGPRVLRGRVTRYRGFAKLVREGLPHASLTAVCEVLDVHEQELAGVLGIASRTLARRAGKRLRPDESDRLFRVAKVLARATDVLGTQDKAAGWMKSPQVALGDQEPLHLLDTEIGEDEVLALLGRIEHGVVS